MLTELWYSRIFVQCEMSDITHSTTNHFDCFRMSMFCRLTKNCAILCETLICSSEILRTRRVHYNWLKLVYSGGLTGPIWRIVWIGHKPGKTT